MQTKAGPHQAHDEHPNGSNWRRLPEMFGGAAAPTRFLQAARIGCAGFREHDTVQGSAIKRSQAYTDQWSRRVLEAVPQKLYDRDRTRHCNVLEHSDITGNVYGLANALSCWSGIVRQKTKAFRWVAHSLGCMLFLVRRDDRIVALAAYHIDDLLLASLLAFTELGHNHSLRNTFTWCDWHSIREGPCKCGGKQLRLEANTAIC